MACCISPRRENSDYVLERNPPKRNVSPDSHKPVRSSSAKVNARKPANHSVSKQSKGQMSSGRARIHDVLTNLNAMADRQATLKRENRELKWRLNVGQRKLEQYEVLESEIPSLVERQALEMHVVSEQLRLHDEKQSRKEQKLRATDDEIERTDRLVNNMQGIVRDRQLDERDMLHRKLTKAEAALDKRDKAIKTLENYSDNLKKSHRHQMNAEQSKSAESRQLLEKLRQKLDSLQSKQEERNKEMEVRNMFTHQTLKPPHRLNDPLVTSRPDDYHERLSPVTSDSRSQLQSTTPYASDCETEDTRRSAGTTTRTQSVRHAEDSVRQDIIEKTTFYDGPTFGSYRPTFTRPPPDSTGGRRRVPPLYSRRILRHPVTVSRDH